MAHKTLTVPIARCKTLSEEEGIAEMYVSVFNNIDHVKDRVKPGFFKESLKKKLPKGVWMHDWSLPVAKTLEAEEVYAGDDRLPPSIKNNGGLRIVGQFNLKTQRGREAFSDLSFGTVDEFSFGYDIEEERYDKATGSNDLIKGTIYEWSPVLVGCNPDTVLVGTKGDKDLKQAKQSKMETKSEMLGCYAEEYATLAALRSLTDALFYNCIYDCLFYNEDDPLETRMSNIQAGLQEYTDIAMRCLGTFMAEDMQEDADEAKSYFKDLWQPQLKDAPQIGTRLEVRLNALLTNAEDCLKRANKTKGYRDEQGRHYSSERREQFKALYDKLGEFLTETEPKADPAEVAARLMAHYQRKARLRDGAGGGNK